MLGPRKQQWRQRIALLILPGVFIGLICCAPHALAGTNEKDNWKTQLNAALRKTELFFSEVRASSITKTSSSLLLKGADKRQMFNTEIHDKVQRSGGASKYLTKIVEPKGKAVETVYCRNPERYVFELERSETRLPFATKSILPKTTAVMERQDIIQYRFLLVSHCVQGIPLSSILKDPSFSVKSFSLDQRTAVLKFEWSPSVEMMPSILFRSAELWFSLEKGWAIEKYHIPVGFRDSKASSLITGTVDYDRMDEGVAVPSQVFERQSSSSTILCVFEKIEHVKSDNHEFTLAYYDLPEPLGTHSPDSVWHIWIALAAFGAIGLACFCLKLKRHSRIPQSPQA